MSPPLSDDVSGGGLTWGTSVHPYDKTGAKRNAAAAAMAFSDNASGTAAGSPLPAGGSPGRGLLSGATERAGYGADYDTSKGENAWGGSGTSIFDPVLTELLVRWFSPPGGHVLDPFAGGSVRGIVAAMLGRKYTGVDLSAVQLAANRVQAERICPANPPTWVHGDSAAVLPTLSVQADMLIACPPYFDLEVYSDHPADISAMSWERFAAAYTAIIKSACALLKPDRFACFVVGDIRDKRGNYRGFPQLTISAFQSAGLSYYNEGVLVTSVGSLPIRAGKQFAAGRKLGRTHQSILGFVKGDSKRAAQACELASAELEVLAYETSLGDPPQECPVAPPSARPVVADDGFDESEWGDGANGSGS